MKKNIKNKVLAFSMASAMVVPNVAVVFAEAPKAGLATVAKAATDTSEYQITVNFILEGNDGQEVSRKTYVLPINVKFAGTDAATASKVGTFDVNNVLEAEGWELKYNTSDGDNAYGVFNQTVYKTSDEGYGRDLYVSAKEVEAPEQEYDNDVVVVYKNIDNNDEPVGEWKTGAQIHGKKGETKKIPGTALTDYEKNVPEGYELVTSLPFDTNGRVADVTDSSTRVELTCYVQTKVEAPAEQDYTNDVWVTYRDVNNNDEKIGEWNTKYSIVGKAGEEKKIPATSLTDYDKHIPEGYKVALPFETSGRIGSVTSTSTRVEFACYVEKDERTLYVNYLDETTGEEVGSEELTVAGSDTYFNTSKLANVPAGYEVCEVGDISFSAATVSIKVRKVAKTTLLHVTYKTADGTEVGEATFEKSTTDEADVTFALDENLPAGYHFAETTPEGFRQVPELTLDAGSSVQCPVYVEQDETQTVLNVTFETPDGTVVGTTSAAKDFTVDEEGVKVATFVVGEDFTLPEGYHFAEDVDQIKEITVNGTVGGHTVIVEKDEEPAPAPSEDPKKDDTKKDTPATATPAPTATAEAKKEETKKASKTANTADSSNVAAYALPLAMSMIAIGAIVVGKKKLS